MKKASNRIFIFPKLLLVIILALICFGRVEAKADEQQSIRYKTEKASGKYESQ